MELVTRDARRSLAKHHTSVETFKNRVTKLSEREEEQSWDELCEEAEKMLKSTMRIAHAYDEIRRQTDLLLTFTEVRIDPLTGLSNRHVIDVSLRAVFAMMARYGTTFSIAIFEIDSFNDEAEGEEELTGYEHVVKEVADLLKDAVRDTDVLARYGGEEFVVIMPETDLEGARQFSDRLRRDVEEQLPTTISGGVAVDGDSRRLVLSRADSALYSAKMAGRNHIYCHNVNRIELVGFSTQKTEAEVSAADDPADGLSDDDRPLADDAATSPLTGP